MRIDLKPRHLFLITLFLLLAAYSLFQARFLILGPQIWIDYPVDGVVINSSLIAVEGRSKNIAWISLNDRQIFTGEDGRFSEKLLVSPGLSIMTVKARDRFGREVEKRVSIVLN